MKQDALNKLKSLNLFAKSASSFWERYDKTTASANCDKYEAKFNGDSRFTVFKTKSPISFNALTGYYGRSGCSTFGGLNDELANTYLLKAMNSLKRELFAEMARLAADDAREISGEAQSELEQMQQLVSEAQQEAECSS